MAVEQRADVRRFRRVPFKRPIKFKVQGREDLMGHLAQDLSEGGLRFMSPEFVAVNTQITVEVQLKDQEKVIDLDGCVKWVRANSVSDVYQLGLEFSDAAAFQRTTIGRFIKSF